MTLLDQLIGKTLPEARELVRGTGIKLQEVIDTPQMFTEQYYPNTINIILDDSGKIESTLKLNDK